MSPSGIVQGAAPAPPEQCQGIQGPAAEGQGHEKVEFETILDT